MPAAAIMLASTVCWLWHRRVWTMTGSEYEEAYANSKDPRVIAWGLLQDAEEYADQANLGSDQETRITLHKATNTRVAAMNKMPLDELPALIEKLTGENKQAVEALRAMRAERLARAANAPYQEPAWKKEQAKPEYWEERKAREAKEHTEYLARVAERVAILRFAKDPRTETGLRELIADAEARLDTLEARRARGRHEDEMIVQVARVLAPLAV